MAHFESYEPLRMLTPSTPVKMERGEQEVLDAAWRRWQQGKIGANAPTPRFGDAWKLENGIALGEETDRYLPAHRSFTVI